MNSRNQLMEEQKELRIQFRQQQEKYVYYVIALSVSSIAFSVYQTTGRHLEWSHVPLGVAVLNWGLSVFCGLRFLAYVISTLRSNIDYNDILLGHHPDIGDHPQNIKAASSGVMKAIQINSRRAKRLFRWQEYFFYLGIVLFLFWHILMMSKQNIENQESKGYVELNRLSDLVEDYEEKHHPPVPSPF